MQYHIIYLEVVAYDVLPITYVNICHTDSIKVVLLRRTYAIL